MLESDQTPERLNAYLATNVGGGNEEPPSLAAWIAANEDRLRAHVAGLTDLSDRLDEKQVSTSNIDLAWHQLETLKTFTWGGIDPIVRFCVPGMTYRGRKVSDAFVEARLKIACDEYVMRGTRLIVRRFLDKPSKHVSLTELAREVFVPQTEEFGEYRRRLRDNVLFQMHEIGIWNVLELSKKKSENGNEFHAGYEISAGPVLLAFHCHIYKPWSKRHAKFACHLLSKMED